MRQVLAKLWNTMIVLLNLVNKAAGTAERVVNTIDNYGQWAEDESAAFVNQSRIEREKRQRDLLKLLEQDQAA